MVTSDPVQAEIDVLLAFNAAAGKFFDLPPQHPDERREFVDAFHRIQDLLGIRMLRHYRPDIFPVKIWPEIDQDRSR